MESVRRKLLKNPLDTASSLSALLFLWTIDIFKKGYRRTLKSTDLYETLCEDRSTNLGDQLESKWKEQTSFKKQPSLIKAIAATFWKKFVFIGMIYLVNDVVIRLLQPYLLGQLLTFFRKGSTMTYNNALCYASAMVILNALNMLTANQFFMGCYHLGMKIRVSLCSLIYRKTLKLSQTVLRGATVVNLLSNDVNRFDMISILLHYMWSAPFITAVVGYFLWLEAGWSGMIGLSVVFAILIIQSCTGKLSSKFRLKIALRTDKRIKFMEEIIHGIRVIKMFAWENPFERMVNMARTTELSALRKNYIVRCFYMTFALFTTRMAVFCTMISLCALYGNESITATKIFVVSAYFQLIAQTLSQMFVRGVAELAEAYVSVKRLQSFLECDEWHHDRITNVDDTSDVDDTVVSMKNVRAKWTVNKDNSKTKSKFLGATEESKCSYEHSHHTLDQINVRIKKGSLVGIIGPVGSGKSSFLQALLSELPLESGSISIRGSVSYSSQEPWIFSGSVRQNILFSNKLDQQRYDQVVAACALSVDMERFTGGDKLLIGDRGVSLSGGQKARINLARSVYRKSDLYLFDDPLSAVDTHVGSHLFNECIGPNGFLAKSGCTRVLVTHQVHFLKDADFVIVLRNGKLDFHGTPTELLNLGIDFSEFLQMNDNDETSSTDGDRNQDHARDSLAEEICTVAGDDEEEVAQLEDVSKGRSQFSVFQSYFRAGANCCVLALVFVMFVLTQILASGYDYWMSYWIGQEEYRQTSLHPVNESVKAHNESNGTATVRMTTSTGISDDYLSTNLCIYIQGALIATLFVTAITRSVSFYTICGRASQKLHNAMFKGIISTALRFFDTNPSGRILNLFAKDLATIDEQLPRSLQDTCQSILVMIGSVALTVTVEPTFVIPIILVGIVFIYVRRVYLKSSKDIKRIEGISRSPIFTHLSATVHGLPTIRAMRAQEVLSEEFDNHQDLHSSCWFMYIATNSAFGLCLDFLCFLIVSCVTFTFLLTTQLIPGNEVGLAITQIMTLTGMLQWGARETAEVSNHLLSVERILQYRDLPSEKAPLNDQNDKLGKQSLPEKTPQNNQRFESEWPSNGRIEFRNVSYRYSEALNPVFRNLNFVVQPNEKIGICGRTGAGKSSLIGALFRLAVIEGDIIIDDINTKAIDLHELRSKIAIIPQDPELFSGTLRTNLDPFDKYSDTEIWKALEDVELKHIAGGPTGLHSSVFAGGSNFSVGEKQLLCLARAILQKSKIIIADEATGNVSLSTDQLIQKKIREKFVNCTVLTIAHRLSTIIDYDRILVMENGEISEFAPPHELLQSKGGTFHSMISSLGKDEAERLTRLAINKAM